MTTTQKRSRRPRSFFLQVVVQRARAGLTSLNIGGTTIVPEASVRAENTEETRTQHADSQPCSRELPRHDLVTNWRRSTCPPTDESEKNLRVGLDIFAVECLILAMNALHACIALAMTARAM